MVPSAYRRNGRRVTSPADGDEEFGSRKKGEESMEVQVKQFPKTRVAAVRHTGPYQECCKAWSAVCAWAGKKGLFGSATKFIGVSYDDPEITPPDKIRYDACVTVGEGVEGEGDVFVQEIGGGEYASAIHKGAYKRLNETFAHICGVWGPQSGREFGSAPCLEVYLNDPERTPEEELLTEVYVPLAPGM
jgi:AraC family transcriptional regulator